MNEPCARITLDVQQSSSAIFVAVKRGDIGRKIVISLSDGGFPYEIASDCYAVLTGTKPDGNILYNHCDIEGNTIVYEITEQTTAAAGRMKAEVKLYGTDDNLITSATFRIIIDGTVYTDSQVESSSEFSALTQLIAQALELIKNGSAGGGGAEIPFLVVPELPTEDISSTTIYLLKDGDEESNVYTEYLYVNGNWEIIGARQIVDLTEQVNQATEAATMAINARDQANNFASTAQKASNTATSHANLASTYSSRASTYAANAQNSAAKAEVAAARAENAASNGGSGVTEESDPTVPSWAKQPEKPGYTAQEVGADPAGTAAEAVAQHNTDVAAHNDLRAELAALAERINGVLDSDDETLDELSEIVAYIKSNKTLIDAITTSKVSVADIVDNLTTNVANRPLSAAQGVVLKGLIDAIATSLSNYALSSAIPTKVSQLTNDAGYLVKQKLTLGIHSDGLVYLFVDGVPVGDGIEMTAGDVYGYVDADNNIVLTGNLAEGTYSIKYEMDDGSTVNIGDLVLDNNVYYPVTNNLVNCTSDGAAQAIGGQSYTAAITANNGYELSSVVVTMGGEDISASAVSGGSVSIGEVTGDIVITAVAEEVKVAEPVTVDIALTDGIRIGSDGGDRALASFCATEMVDLRSIPKPCTIHLTKAKWCSDGSLTTVRYYVADASGTALDNGPTKAGVTDYFTVIDNNGDCKDIDVTVTSDNVGYLRFSGMWGGTGTTENPAVFEDVKATLTYTPES